MGGESYIGHVPPSIIQNMRKDDRLIATSDFSWVARADALSICVPTPLDKARQPDLTAVQKTVESLVPHLRPGQLVILESTTYPGTTTEVVLPILQKSGLIIGEELFVGYSPEREDPANPNFTARSIPKVVGANDPASRRALEAFYGAVFDQIIPVSSCEAAEMSKMLENIYRCVNIALVNELKLLCQRMGLNIWEIVDAAKTKPFGFHAFYPGPGLGGHCIPIDPFYLSGRPANTTFSTRFIELAGEVNTNMPYEVVARVAEHLSAEEFPPVPRACWCSAGLQEERGRLPRIAIHQNPKTARGSRLYPFLLRSSRERLCIAPLRAAAGVELPELTDEAFLNTDATLILTDHDSFDYEPHRAAVQGSDRYTKRHSQHFHGPG